MRKKEIIAGILLISLGFLVFLSLLYFNPTEPTPNQDNEVQHKMGIIGFWVSYYLVRKTIGYASIIFPVLIMIWGVNLIKEEKLKRLLRHSLILLLFAFYVSVTTAIFSFPRNLQDDQLLDAVSKQPWGTMGGLTTYTLYEYLGRAGSIIFFFTIVLITILTVIEINFTGLFQPVKQWLSGFQFIGITKDKMDMAKRKRKIVVGRGFSDEDVGITDEMEPGYGDTGDIRVKPPTAKAMEETAEFDEDEPDRRDYVQAEYKLPQPSLLDESPKSDDEVSWDEFMTSAKTLEEKLADFGIQGKVIEINPGPVITRYEIEPAPGVKVNRFTSLADDLALVMRAKRIRVIAPIPGKAAIGIEIPNRKPSIVYLKEIIESPKFKAAKSPLTILLGKTIAGDVYVTDLASMPHLLIAGSTGSGKSVCLHSMIASILFKAKPSDVQLIMIDPKRLELAPYAVLKNHHVASREDIGETVVTTASNAVLVLKSLEREMERRYELLARVGVRNIEDYNNWLRSPEFQNSAHSEIAEKLPYIVLIIDELADLMLIAAREVEEPIARLTQMSRAVGIHLVVATQRPSVDVITGVIKANFPARIAFQVATKTDSRTIIDMNGAEKLLGKGDMLFISPGSPEAVRIHNAYISHEEVKRIIEHIRQQPEPEVKTKLLSDDESDGSLHGKNRTDERDELFDEALKLVVRHQQGSSSLLQRRLKIGYTRAARIIDQLEEAGFVGPFDGSKAREVLVDDDQLREMGII